MKKLQKSFFARYKPWLGVIPLAMVLLLVPQVTHAGYGAVIIWLLDNVVSFFLFLIVSFFAGIFLILLWILVQIGTYNSFLDAKAVVIGWAVVRDVVNIGFIIGLLMIAFGTVLRVQTYHYKSTLVKLLIMALLVNFSKIISGVFIDFSQVVMLTFFHAIEDSVGVFVVGFGVDAWLNSDTNIGTLADTQASPDTYFRSLFMAIFMSILACVVVLVMIIMLLWRVLMLWVLVIFSPVAYIAQAIPSLKSYGDKWWQSFSKYLINGPVMAFLLWLALSVVAFNYTENQANPSGAKPIISGVSSGGDVLTAVGEVGGVPPAVGPSKASQPPSVFDYLTVMALMVMAISLAASAGVMGAGFAGKALNTVRAAGSLPYSGLKKASGYAAELATERGWGNYLPSTWKKAWQESRAETKERRMDAGLAKARERLGKKGGPLAWLGSPKDLIQNYANLKTLTTWGGMKSIGRMLTGRDVEQRKKLMEQVGGVEQQIEEKQKQKAKMAEDAKLSPEEAGAKEMADQMDQQAADLSKISNEDEAMHKMVASGEIDLKGHPEFRIQLLAEMKHQKGIMDDAHSSDKDKKDAAKRHNALKKLQAQVDTGAENIKLAGPLTAARTIMGASKASNRQEALKKEVTRLRTISNEDKVKKFNEDTKPLDDELKVLKKQKSDLYDRAIKIQPPEMFNARGAYRALIDSESKKVAHIKESGELIALLKDAVHKEDKARAAAIMYKLTKDYNENDFLNEMGYNSSSINDMHAFFLEKVVGGQTVRRKDGKYVTDEQTGKLLVDKDASVKGLGMEEQTAFSLEQDLGYIAEDNNHQTMARGIGYKHGKLMQRSEMEQSDAIVNEMEKQDAENLARRMNRLGVGGETPDGQFELGMTGAKWFLRNWKSLESMVITRKNMNRSLVSNLTSPKSLATLRELSGTIVPSTEKAAFEKILNGMITLGKERQRDSVETVKTEVERAFKRAA